MSLQRFLQKSAGFLVLPLALLLFAQWPLREWVQAYSRQANDAAQILFALYMAVAVTAASLDRTHLAASHRASNVGAPAARWKRWALLACVGPWALFTLWAAWPIILSSVLQWEKFGETLTPGFFLVKLALGCLLLLVLVDAALQLVTREAPKP